MPAGFVRLPYEYEYCTFDSRERASAATSHHQPFLLAADAGAKQGVPILIRVLQCSMQAATKERYDGESLHLS